MFRHATPVALPNRVCAVAALAVAGTFAAMTTARAQSTADLLSNTAAQPVFRQPPEPERYNLKWRNLIARFQMSLAAEATDNINLSDEDAQADVGFGPSVDAGFLWRISDINLLQVDAGIGYRWYLEHPSLQSISVAPNSRLDYQIQLQHARISFHDSFSIQVDPTSRPDVSGDGSEDVTEFRRLSNVSGVTAEWMPNSDVTVVSGYDLTLDRSLSGEFDNIDRNGHTFSLGGFYTLSQRTTAGLSGYYNLSSFAHGAHNDSYGYGFGPVALVELSRFIKAEVSLGYAVTDFDSSGTIADTTDFEGVTGQLTLRHKLNSRIHHELTVSHGMESALESNFYEITSARYAVNARIRHGVSLHARLHAEHFSTSGSPDEQAERYGFYLGAGYQVRRNWQLSAGYSLQLKESNRPNNDYLQNRMTVSLSRQF